MGTGLTGYTPTEIYNMDYDALVEAIEDTLGDAWDSPENFEFLLNSASGHFDIHSGKSPKELARRLISDNELSAASCFDTKEEAYDRIACALLNESKQIADWLQKDWHITPENEYNKLSLIVDMHEEDPIGYGIDKQFREKGTGAIKIVLERDKPISHVHSIGCPCGFYIVTAYPDMSHESAKFTGRQFTPEELANDIQGSDNPLERTETYLHNKKPPEFATSVRFIPANNGYFDALKIKIYKPDQLFIAYMDRSEVKTKVIEHDKATNLSSFELATKYPDVSKYLAHAKNVYHKFSKGEKLGVDDPFDAQKKMEWMPNK